MVIIGSGRVARFVVDTLSAMGRQSEVSGCLVEKSYKKEPTGLKVDVFSVSSFFGPDFISVVRSLKDSSFFIAVGSPVARREIAHHLVSEFGDASFPNIIDSRAYVSSSANLGSGNYVGPFSSVLPGSDISDFCIIEDHVSVGIDVLIRSFCTVCPGCCLTASVSVEEGVFVGVGAKVAPELTIASEVIVGAGAIVINDCSRPQEIVVGNPARRLHR